MILQQSRQSDSSRQEKSYWQLLQCNIVS